jgi:diguanylate cyclase (GGDEF)-like protein
VSSFLREPAIGHASLRGRLLLLVSLVVWPVFGLMVWSAYDDRQARLHDAELLAERVAGRAAGEFGQIVEFTRELMNRVGAEPEVRHVTDAHACSRALAAVRSQHPAFGLIGVVARNGKTVCSDTGQAVGIDLSDRDYFRRAIETRDFVVSGFVVGRTTGMNIMVLAAPIIGPGGDVTEVMFLSLDLAWIRRQMEGLIAPPGSNLILVDGKGTVMAAYPDAQAVVGRTIPERDALFEQGRFGKAAGKHVIGLDGVSRVVVSVALPRAPAGAAFVRAGIPTASIIADADHALRRNLLALGGLALLTYAAAWWLASLLVVWPTRRLIAAAESLREGDMTARTQLKHGADELGQLALHFDAMAARVERVTRALRALSACNRNLLRAVDEAVLLDEMCRIAVREGGYRVAWVGLLTGDAEQTLVTAAVSGAQDDLNRWVEEHAGKASDGPAARAIRTGTTQVRPSVVHQPPAPEGRAGRPGFAACALPLKVHGDTIGALKLYADDPDSFDATELELVEEMAADLAFGIQTLRDRRLQAVAEERIRQMAYVDSLTGLSNRTRLEMVVGEALADASRTGQGFAVIALSLAHFTRIQNAIGFTEGDRLIVEAAHRLQSTAAPTWSVARLVGDRFAILVPAAGAAAATAAARRLETAFERPFSIAGIDVEANANLGIALYPEHGDDPELLLRRADVACIEAQANGSGIELYRGKGEEEDPARLQRMVDLRRAIDEGQLAVHYQGKVDAHTGAITGAEALVRWQHPTQGNIPPGMFIAGAEQTGLIKPLTRWVLAAVVRQLHDWSHNGLTVPVAVNFSGGSFRDPGLVDELQRLLERWQVDPRLLQIEITETVLMHDAQAAQRVLARLRAIGIVILLDDFGTGYSSLRYLASLPVDVIKIDRSFIIEIVHRPEMRALVAAMIDMGHKLGLKLVAEGVDAEHQAQLLRGMGCDEIQGFLYCKPLASRAFEDWARSLKPAPAGQSPPEQKLTS